MTVDTQGGKLDHFGRRRFLQVILMQFFTVGLVFAAAGRLDLPWVWVYLGLALAGIAIGGGYVLQHNPDAINERGRRAEHQKSWDKSILAIYTPLAIGSLIVAGLDARFNWSQVPTWLHLVGVLFNLLSSFLTYAAMAHNKFLAQVVQVAVERGHRVATTGPYGVIRHPMYTAILMSWFTTGFLLGSWWVLVPGMLCAGLIVLRTWLEDRTLREELAGYAEYTKRVRFRLVPGIW